MQLQRKRIIVAFAFKLKNKNFQRAIATVISACKQIHPKNGQYTKTGGDRKMCDPYPYGLSGDVPLDTVWFFTSLFPNRRKSVLSRVLSARLIWFLIEDEIHLLFNCSKYPLIRNYFYNKVKILIPNTTQLPVNDQWTDEHI